MHYRDGGFSLSHSPILCNYKILHTLYRSSIRVFISVFSLIENISLRPVEGVTDGYFTSGIRIQFKCDFDNKFSFIAFKHNDTQLSSGDRISINSNISRPSLVVNVPEVTDAGVWSCIVKRVNGKQKFVMQKVLEHVG